MHEIYTVPTLIQIAPKLNIKDIFRVFDNNDAFHHIKLDEQLLL